MFFSGENRVSFGNFRSKFEGLSRAYFRFDLDEVLQLIDLLQVWYIFGPNKVRLLPWCIAGNIIIISQELLFLLPEWFIWLYVNCLKLWWDGQYADMY